MRTPSFLRRLVALFCFVLLATVAFEIVGCASTPPPPPLRVEVRPARPGPKAVWVPGHWKWRGRARGHVWIPGHWKVR